MDRTEQNVQQLAQGEHKCGGIYSILYASMLAASNVPGKRVEDTVDEGTKDVVDQEGGDLNRSFKMRNAR